MTGRLPFNPRKTSAATHTSTAGTAPESDRPFSVTTLASMISEALADGLPKTIRVVGEVSGFRERTHWYFDLKDAQSVLPCAMFASSLRKLAFVLEDGQEVVLTGRLDLYAKTGKLSFIATRAEPIGAGALELEYKRLVESMRAKGWFDPERKRPIPSFPRRVAVITSRSGAALQDVIDTMQRRASAVGVLIADARVQGDGAAEEITDRIRQINRNAQSLGVDVIVVTRGGGSMQDLWAFNDPALAETILNSALPVIAAVGHETDITVAELVADLRAATPTQAAMAVTPDAQALLEQVDRLRIRLTRAKARLVVSARQRLQTAASRRFLRDPDVMVGAARTQLESGRCALRQAAQSCIRDRQAQLDRLALRLNRIRPIDRAAREHAGRIERLAAQSFRLRAAMKRSVVTKSSTLEARSRELEAVAPIAVLRRGFSVTLDQAGRVVTSVEQAPLGTPLETRLADGSFKSVVGTAADRSRAPKISKHPQRAADPDQLDLFRARGSAMTRRDTTNTRYDRNESKDSL